MKEYTKVNITESMGAEAMREFEEIEVFGRNGEMIAIVQCEILSIESGIEKSIFGNMLITIWSAGRYVATICAKSLIGKKEVKETC